MGQRKPILNPNIKQNFKANSSIINHRVYINLLDGTSGGASEPCVSDVEARVERRTTERGWSVNVVIE
jgi:hypothetical protein